MVQVHVSPQVGQELQEQHVQGEVRETVSRLVRGFTDLSCPSQVQRQKERSQEQRPVPLQRQNSNEVREKELDLFCSKNVLSQISLHEGKVPDPEQRQRPSVQREETLLSVSQVQVQVSLQVTQEAEEGVHNARHHAVCRDEEEETSEGQTGGQEVEQERGV